MAISHVARSAEYQQISDAKITGISLKKPYNTSNLLGVVIYVFRKRSKGLPLQGSLSGDLPASGVETRWCQCFV
ncbi:MAG: hypothetical protein L0H28_06380, partial [Corynebacterium casei]|nr:hypothetical protein [Corynebacterium casei]